MHVARVIPHIIDRHAEDAAFLWLLRAAAVGEPHYNLDDLAELDERLEANLDGLVVAGAAGWDAAAEQLELGEPGEVFLAAWLALHSGDGDRLDRVFELALAARDNRRALLSAMAWHPLARTGDWLATMLRANDPNCAALAVRAYALHRHDPGPALTELLNTHQPDLLIACLRACGELRRLDAKGAIQARYQDARSDVAFWAQWAGALLGDRQPLTLLKLHCLTATAYAYPALEVLMRALAIDEASDLLRQLAAQPATERLAMQGAGMSGDLQWIPGLIARMTQPELTRVCGEAVALLTGADLAYLDLDTDQPADWESGPNDDPADEVITLDSDSSLPWPSAERVADWWQLNRQRFIGASRWICGAPATAEHCSQVLRRGYQRQRRAAAIELALQGQRLFEIRAPGARQRSQLGNAN